MVIKKLLFITIFPIVILVGCYPKSDNNFNQISIGETQDFKRITNQLPTEYLPTAPTDGVFYLTTIPTEIVGSWIGNGNKYGDKLMLITHNSIILNGKEICVFDYSQDENIYTLKLILNENDSKEEHYPFKLNYEHKNSTIAVSMSELIELLN